MKVRVQFFSYFKDLTECGQMVVTVPEGMRLAELHEQLQSRFPELGAMRKSTLLAVGVDYADGSYLLQEGDEVSLFPPVQGG